VECRVFFYRKSKRHTGHTRKNAQVVTNLQQACSNSELKQVTFLTTRTSTGSKVDVFHQSQPLTQSSDVTHAVRVVKNVTCLSSLMMFEQLVNRLCSHCLLTTCYKVIELNRLVTSCSNNLLSSCNSSICQQVVNKNNSIVKTC
jgi:hypothetical protein